MDTLCLFNDIFLRMAILYFVAKIKTAAQGDGFIRHGLRRLSGVFF